MIETGGFQQAATARGSLARASSRRRPLPRDALHVAFSHSFCAHARARGQRMRSTGTGQRGMSRKQMENKAFHGRVNAGSEDGYILNPNIDIDALKSAFQEAQQLLKQMNPGAAEWMDELFGEDDLPSQCACGPCSAQMTVCPYCQGDAVFWMDTAALRVV